jgi:hypothetical protein
MAGNPFMAAKRLYHSLTLAETVGSWGMPKKSPPENIKGINVILFLSGTIRFLPLLFFFLHSIFIIWIEKLLL